MGQIRHLVENSHFSLSKYSFLFTYLIPAQEGARDAFYHSESAVVLQKSHEAGNHIGQEDKEIKELMGKRIKIDKDKIQYVHMNTFDECIHQHPSTSNHIETSQELQMLS